MNKVITINLNGNAYQLEEGGFDLLRAYLDGATRRLEGNPDRDEIMADIEQAIADKCRAVLGTFKTVVVARELQQIIEEMGPVENLQNDEPAAATGHPTGGPGAARDADPRPEAGAPGAQPRRLYKIYDGAMLGGVCSGLAAYFGVDVTLVRIGFALLTVIWGAGILVYFFLWMILPTADTAAEKAAAHGMPSTAQEFIRRAREGYYEGMRSFSDRHAHREWRRRFRREMRGWRRMFKHEMRTNADHWRYHWAAGFSASPGAWLALPFVSLLRGGVVVLWLLALVSLLATGAVFGVDLPAGVPVWAGTLILVAAYNLVAWPIKAIRRGYYYSAGIGPHHAPPFVWILEALIGFGFLVLVVWLAAHHSAEIRTALGAVPSTVRQGADAVKAWWNRP